MSTHRMGMNIRLISVPSSCIGDVAHGKFSLYRRFFRDAGKSRSKILPPRFSANLITCLCDPSDPAEHISERIAAVGFRMHILNP